MPRGMAAENTLLRGANLVLGVNVTGHGGSWRWVMNLMTAVCTSLERDSGGCCSAVYWWAWAWRAVDTDAVIPALAET